MWHTAQSRTATDRSRIADLDRMVHDLEERIAGLSRMVQNSRASPSAIDRVSDTVATALQDVADRFRGHTRQGSAAASQLGDEAMRYGNEALRYGNDAMRKLSREVEHRPLLMLAVAVGVGALAMAVLARRD